MEFYCLTVTFFCIVTTNINKNTGNHKMKGNKDIWIKLSKSQISSRMNDSNVRTWCCDTPKRPTSSFNNQDKEPKDDTEGVHKQAQICGCSTKNEKAGNKRARVSAKSHKNITGTSFVRVFIVKNDDAYKHEHVSHVDNWELTRRLITVSVIVSIFDRYF